MKVHARPAWRLTGTPTAAAWKLRSPRQRLDLIHQAWTRVHAANQSEESA